MCVCSRAALQDVNLLNKGMKGKLIEEEREAEVKVGRSVSFDLGAGGEEDHEVLDEALEDPWKDLHYVGQAAVRQSQGSTIIVEQPSVEAPLEDFDIPFKEDALKMKEMGLPLGFNNVSPYEVEEGGFVVETHIKDRLTKGKKKGKKKRRQQVVDEETKMRFDEDWWAIHGQAKVMEVWKERYGKFMDDQEEEEEVQDDGNEEENQTWQEYEEQGKEHIGNDASQGPCEESKAPLPEDVVGGWGTASSVGVDGGDGAVGWGQAPPPSTTASGWGDAGITSSAVPSSKSSGGNESGGGGGWGEGVGGQQGGAVWGDTWGGGDSTGGGGGQADWDTLWVEVTNEVYKAEMAKWMHSDLDSGSRVTLEAADDIKEEVNRIEEDLARVNLEKAEEKPIHYRLEEKEAEQEATKNAARETKKTAKVNSGLAGLLRQLQLSEDPYNLAEDGMNQTQENADEENEEGPVELRVEREAPGLDQALKAFDQLGYVFEQEAGVRWEGTPGVR